MPAWVVDQLISKGYLTEQGLSRKAKVIVHRPCGQATISGLDGARCALDAWCDPAPLNAQGEVAALLQGRWTYRLDGVRLDRRTRWTIGGHPPDHRVLVLAEHRCGEVIPTAWRLPPAPPSLPTPATPTDRLEF